MKDTDILTVEMICARYQCARHTASAIMHRIPCFYAGKRLFVRAKDLDEWERGQMIYPLPKGGRKPKETLYAIPRRKAE